MDLCFSCWGEGLSVNQWLLPERMELPYVSLKKIQIFFPWKQRLSRDDVNAKYMKEIY